MEIELHTPVTQHRVIGTIIKYHCIGTNGCVAIRAANGICSETTNTNIFYSRRIPIECRSANRYIAKARLIAVQCPRANGCVVYPNTYLLSSCAETNSDAAVI